jgi:glucose/arabinose dehydrogenase
MKPFILWRIAASTVLFFCFIDCANKTSIAKPQPELISFYPIYSAKDFQPVHIANANDRSDRLFIADIVGKIMIYKNGQMLKKPFLDLEHYLPKGEMRLISIAFHPDFRTTGVFFVYYTDLLGKVYIERFRASKTYPDTAIIESGAVVYSAQSKTGGIHHYGGDIHFGKDDYLYAAIGYLDKQGDPARQAQNMRLPFGKILRLDVNVKEAPYYAVPHDNPFINRTDTLPEIWASGLRNPWRFSFDKETGDFWLGDVGQNKYEEIDFRRFTDPGGVNFGWSCYEAGAGYDLTDCTPLSNYSSPIFWYEHNYKTGNSITGGVVYRGKAYPSLSGCYICADFDSNEAWLIKRNEDSFVTYNQKTGIPGSIVSFGEDEKGEVYAASYNGVIYKVMEANATIPSAGEAPASKAEKIKKRKQNKKNNASDDLY